MPVNVSSIKYNVQLITRTGGAFSLNNVLNNLQWEEQISELSQRATITVVNTKTNDKLLIDMASLNCPIYISAEWGGGKSDKVFDGTVWEWQYVSATQKELTITAYDPFIRLQQSKDFFYFPKGLNTRDIINKICGEWGIAVSYEWGRSITHEKKTFSGNTISDMIFSLLEEVRQKTGEKYIAYYRDSKLVITGYGRNKSVYRFDFENTVETSDKFTLNNLVTQVKIIGKEDKSGRAPVEAIVKGDQQYGVLQEIIRRDENKKLAAVMDEANTIIKERGSPDETIQVDVPDLPFLRKGDLVEMCAGNLLGFFYTEGVTHNATERKMKLTLSRSAERG